MARKKKRKKRRIRWKAILMLLGVIVSLVILLYLIVILFETKKINITGNQYSSVQEVQEWVQSDKYSSNTLYIMWKYNKEDIEQLPVIEKTSVKLESPWEVTIQVTEKAFSGRVDFNGEHLYFDKDGMAVFKSGEVIEGVPYIEGMGFDAEKVKLGEVLPAKDVKVFQKINSITALLEQAGLTADKISCDGNSLVLYFGVVRVQMGSSGYEEKLSHMIPVLEKLQELYPERAGVLHLENYTSEDSSIQFVPDPPAE